MPAIVLTIDGREGVFPLDASYGQAVEALFPERPLRPLAVSVEGRVLCLGHRPRENQTLQILDYAQDEGRRVYERSMRFLFLLALKDLLPGAKVRIEHSVHYGIYARLDQPADEALVRQIEARMRAHVRQDSPFLREEWPLEKALAHFKAQGQSDTYRLLATWETPTLAMYRCDGLVEHFFGELVPSAGLLNVFSLRLYAPGIVIQLPSAKAPGLPAKGEERPKYMRTFEESARWSQILHCASIADLNDLVRGGQLRDFIRVNEALHEKSIADIADQIVRHKARVVLVAGPSSSGKTTFTNRLAIHLRVNGKRPIILSLDDYYRDRAEVPLGEDGKPDLEALDALNVPLLNLHLTRLIQGETVQIPHFDFQQGRSIPGKTLAVREDQPLLIEGIHGLNPQLSQAIPSDLQFRVYISALTTLNLDAHNRIRTTDVRLIRRMVRDHQFRNSPIEQTLSMWASVRHGEEAYIFPYQELADVMFNSIMHYELAVLKAYVTPLLEAAAPDSAHTPTLRRLRNFLQFVECADAEDEIGPVSILREFIGGCTFYQPTPRKK